MFDLFSRRARLTQQLQESQDITLQKVLFQQLFANAPIGIAMVDDQDHIQSVNHAFEITFQYRLEEIAGRPINDVIVPANHREEATQLSSYVLHGTTVQRETVRQRKDGSPVLVEVYGVPILRDGKTVGVYAIYVDITERQRAEQALRESEDRYRDLVEASPVILILHDLQGHVISANPAAAKLLGYANDELTRLNVRDGLAPQARDQMEAYLATVQRDHQASGLMRVRTRAGEQRILEFTSTLRTEGVATPVVRAMARDVTDLKRAERAQARLARQMAALYETSLEINAQTDLAQLLPTIVRRAADLLNARLGALYLMQPDNETLKLVVSHNLPSNYAGTILRLGEGLSGRVAQTGQPLMVEDYKTWEGQAGVYSNAPFRRVLGVPLKTGSHVIGVLNVTDTEKTGPYQEEEIRLANLFADQAAVAIENARLFAETKRRADEFAALYETSRGLAELQDVKALLETIVQHAITLLAGSGGGMYLYDAARGDLEVVVATHASTPVGTRLQIGEGMAGRVAQTRQPLIVDDYRTWAYRSPKFAETPITAIIETPMLFAGELIGVLVVEEIRETTHKFTEADARLLSLFAAQAAGAVYNARLLQQTAERAEQLALLYDAVLTLNRAIEPHQVIEHLLEITHRSVRADRADFHRFDPTQHTLTLESSSGYAADRASTLRALHFAEGEPRGLVGLVAHERVPLYLPDALADPRWIPIDPAIHSAFWVPVEHEQQLYGVLVVTSKLLDAFTPADQRLVTLFANQVAVALERANLFEAEQNRRAELTALNDLARTLADTDALETIRELVAQRAVEMLQVTCARLALIEGDALIIQATWPIRLLDCELGLGQRAVLADLPCCQRALEERQPTILATTDASLTAAEREFLLGDLAKTHCLVPLRAGSHALGLLILSEARGPGRASFTPEKARLARSIGDQAASAMRRTKLREQIEHQLRQAQGLHAIDLAITASLDLNVTLNVLLTQVVTQLRADAADVLRFDPETQTLEYLAGLGFRAQAIEESQLRLGKEYAGRAALERRVISEPDLQSHRGTLLRSFLCTDETFASCVCVPLIAKGQLKGVLEIFYRTPISPETPWLEVMEAIGTQAAIAIDNAELFDNLQRSNLQLALTNNALIEGWARTLALRDPASAEHAERVAELTLRLAQSLQVREAELPHLRHGALLHDVGKLASPAALWRKRGAFTRKEQQSLRHEPLAAYDILSANAYLRPLLDIPYGQHERWDGSGYPRGLAGENIPVAARVFAVAHAWDTLTVSPSDQPTRTRDQARQYLRRMAGKRFDPRVVQAFLQIVDEAGVANGKGNA